MLLPQAGRWAEWLPSGASRTEMPGSGFSYPPGVMYGHSGNAPAVMWVMDQLANGIHRPVQAASLGTGLRGWGRFTSLGDFFQAWWWGRHLGPGGSRGGLCVPRACMGLPGSPSEDPHSQESDDQAQAQPVTRLRARSSTLRHQEVPWPTQIIFLISLAPAPLCHQIFDKNATRCTEILDPPRRL